MFDTAVRKIAQEGIARAQRQKSQGRRLAVERLREQPVDNLERGTVATDSDEVSKAACIGLARDFCGIARSAGRRDFYLEAAGTQALQNAA